MRRMRHADKHELTLVELALFLVMAGLLSSAVLDVNAHMSKTGKKDIILREESLSGLYYPYYDLSRIDQEGRLLTFDTIHDDSDTPDNRVKSSGRFLTAENHPNSIPPETIYAVHDGLAMDDHYTPATYP